MGGDQRGPPGEVSFVLSASSCAFANAAAAPALAASSISSSESERPIWAMDLMASAAESWAARTFLCL